MARLGAVAAAVAVAAGSSAALAGNGHGNGGNSGAAKTCQKGGFKKLQRADGTAFKNTGKCVSYAAKGGVLYSPSVVAPAAVASGAPFTVTATGFTPNAALTLTLGGVAQAPVTTDGSGAAGVPGLVYSCTAPPTTVDISVDAVDANGVHASAHVVVTCDAGA